MAEEKVRVQSTAIDIDPKSGRLVITDPKVIDMLKRKGITSPADLKKPGIVWDVHVGGEF
jgi:hypothetical protein